MLGSALYWDLKRGLLLLVQTQMLLEPSFIGFRRLSIGLNFRRLHLHPWRPALLSWEAKERPPTARHPSSTERMSVLKTDPDSSIR